MPFCWLGGYRRAVTDGGERHEVVLVVRPMMPLAMS